MGPTVVSPARMMSLPSEICVVVLRALTVSLGVLKIVAESATPREDPASPLPIHITVLLAMPPPHLLALHAS